MNESADTVAFIAAPFRLSALLAAHDVDQHSENEDDALDDHLPVGLDAQKRHAVADRLEDQRAQQRAGDLAAAAGEADAAQNDGGDDVHVAADAAGGQRNADLRGEQNAAQRARHGAVDEAAHLDAADVDAGEIAGVLIAADGVDLPSEARIFQNIGRDGKHDDHQQHDDRHAEDIAAADKGQKIIADENVLAVGDQIGKAAVDLLRAERGDDRVDAADRNQNAVEQAEQNARQQRADDRDACGQPRPQHQRHHHAGYRRDGILRQIHGREDHGDRDAEGHDRVDGCVGRDIDQIPQRQEVRRHDREQDAHHKQRQDQAEVRSGL